jgi:hypothetical protein
MKKGKDKKINFELRNKERKAGIQTANKGCRLTSSLKTACVKDIFRKVAQNSTYM